jgi:pyruvate/2-oxoglutarate dehydrogenase complex dihydrolipoamide dehydrogenase (E3) component
LGLERILSLIFIFDADAILRKAPPQEIPNGVIIEEGYIGLELAETLTRLSEKTTKVEIKPAFP